MTVLGDVMLDQFLWGTVARISPEAPVPVVEFERESFIPGGAGNVARNLAHLRVATDLLGVSGHDDAAGSGNCSRRMGWLVRAFSPAPIA